MSQTTLHPLALIGLAAADAVGEFMSASHRYAAARVAVEAGENADLMGAAGNFNDAGNHLAKLFREFSAAAELIPMLEEPVAAPKQPSRLRGIFRRSRKK